MEEGFIYSRDSIKWTPKDKKEGNNIFPKDYEVVLCGICLFGKAEIQVYRCKECGIELILEGQCQLPPDGCVV